MAQTAGRSPATAATAAQIKKIHALKGALALDDDTYRAMLADAFGVGSSKQLDLWQAGQLIEIVEKAAVANGWQPRKAQPKKYSDLSDRCGGMASAEQLRLIEVKWNAVSRAETTDDRRKALRSFVTRIAKVSDLRFLTAECAGKVINALKTMEKKTAAAAEPKKSKSPLPKTAGN